MVESIGLFAKSNKMEKRKKGNEMEKFKVAIEERLCKEFEVEAKTQEEAEEIAKKKYFDGEFVLDNADVNCRLISTADKNGDFAWFNEF